MAAGLTDKFKKVGSSTVTTLSAPGKALAASSITVGSTANYPTDTGFILAIRQVDSNGALVAGTYTEWPAILTSGTTFTIATTPSLGTDQVYPAGSTTQVFIPLSRVAHNTLIDALLQEHDQDGTHGNITAGTIAATGTISAPTLSSTGDVQLRSNSLETIQTEYTFDFVASGGVWTGDSYGSTLNASMTAATVYINGRRGTLSAVTARAFTASKDTYIDVLNTAGVFTLVYTEVANNAASPALAANSIRIGIIVTGAGNIAAVGSVNQGQEDKVLPIASSIAYAVTDSLGNLICPRDPNRRVLGYRQITSLFSTATAGSDVDVTGLSVPVIIPTGRKVKMSAWGVGIRSTQVAGNDLIFSIKESTTVIAQSAPHTNVANFYLPAWVSRGMITPSAGSHTYKATIQGSAAGTTSLNANASSPAYIMVELD